MREIYITITGMRYYYGNEILKKGDKVRLVKEPENEHDKEAIEVKLEGLGRIGYVANSPRTVIGECLSAGRLYDKIGKKANAEVIHVIPQGAVCRIINKDRKDL